MVDIPATDLYFTDVVITDVTTHSAGFTICHSNGWVFGGVPADSPVIPCVGMVARFYPGGLGRAVYGLCLDGVPIFYKTPEQREAEREKHAAEWRERDRLAALEPKLPEPQTPGFEWTEDMGEVSGFHGGYERTCRAMVSAGCQWWSGHPDADPQFYGFENVYGIVVEDNEDAKTLSKVIEDAAMGDCTGAMHQACIGHIMAWRRLGSWLAYQREMRKPAP